MLGGIGILDGLEIWRNEPIGPLIAGHWVFLMLLRALPHTPGHDGVRLFLPAFGVLALWAALEPDSCSTGGAAGPRWPSRRHCSRGRQHRGDDARAAFVFQPAGRWTARGDRPGDGADVLLGRSQPGSRGVARRAHAAGRDDRVRDVSTLLALSAPIGHCPRGWSPIDRGQPKWYVLQNRPGAFSDARPVTRRQWPAAYTVTKLGVPLIWIFPFSELERLNARARNDDTEHSDRARKRTAPPPDRTAPQ